MIEPYVLFEAAGHRLLLLAELTHSVLPEAPETATDLSSLFGGPPAAVWISCQRGEVHLGVTEVSRLVHLAPDAFALLPAPLRRGAFVLADAITRGPILGAHAFRFDIVKLQRLGLRGLGVPT